MPQLFFPKLICIHRRKKEVGGVTGKNVEPLRFAVGLNRSSSVSPPLPSPPFLDAAAPFVSPPPLSSCLLTRLRQTWWGKKKSNRSLLFLLLQQRQTQKKSRVPIAVNRFHKTPWQRSNTTSPRCDRVKAPPPLSVQTPQQLRLTLFPGFTESRLKRVEAERRDGD